MSDGAEDATYIINKLLSLRLFTDEKQEHWKKNIVDLDGEILLISQFTLLAKTCKGAKPSFHNAMPAEKSKVLFHSIVDQLKAKYKTEKIQSNSVFLLIFSR